MGDMGDIFREFNKDRQEKRAQNRQSSPAILEEKGISFTTHNHGSHLIVKVGDESVDFWPGTGKWVARKDPRGRGRGVFMLVHYVKEKEGAAV